MKENLKMAPHELICDQQRYGHTFRAPRRRIMDDAIQYLCVCDEPFSSMRDATRIETAEAGII